MEHDENPDIEQEQQNEEVESTEVETTEDADTEDELSKARAEAAKWRRLAEKNQKTKVQSPKSQNTNPTVDVEELKLIARGLSDEDIDQAKVIARGMGTTLTEAMKSPLFTSYQSSVQEAKKREDAKLGASRGSGHTQEELDIVPEMNRNDHKAKFDELTRS